MVADPSVPWDLVSQIRRSERKSQIILSLDEGPAPASDVAETLDLKTGTVSNYFYDLKNMEPPMLVCITPDQPHHRLYDTTEQAEKLVPYIG